MRKQRDGFYSTTINGTVIRDLAPIGSKYWFEYHCYEGWDSADVEAWMHSHQQVEVIGVAECENLCFRTLAERVNPKDFQRPHPPVRNQKLIDKNKK